MLKDLDTLIRAVLTRERAEIGMGICGLIALLTPLLLWVSWSVLGLKIILATGFFAFLLATWFAQYAAPETVDPDQERLPKPGELPLLNADAQDRERKTWRDIA